MIGTVPEAELPKWRVQCRAHALFAGGKKELFSLKGAWDGHYAEDPASLRLAFEAAQGAAVFDAPVTKLTRKGKPVDGWMLALTPHHLLRTQGWKPPGKRALALDAITEVALSASGDALVRVRTTDARGDRVYAVVGEGGINLAPEFAVRLATACKSATGSDVPITIVPAPLTFNGGSGDVELRVMKHPAEVKGTSWDPKSKVFLYA